MDLYTVRNNIMKGVPLQELNLRVCFYARVSTDKDEQLHSLQSQISFFNDYISKVPNWEFIGSYIDEGISGTSVNKREEFLRMTRDAKSHKFDFFPLFYLPINHFLFIYLYCTNTFFISKFYHFCIYITRFIIKNLFSFLQKSIAKNVE